MSAVICRLCGRSANKLLNVFTKGFEDIELAVKIQLCFDVQIKEDDGISKRICKSCYYFSNSMYEYRQLAQEINQKLWKEYDKSQKSVPPTITQQDFLESFNLTTKKPVEEKAQVRPLPRSRPRVSESNSVRSLKRKYPGIVFPENCGTVNFEAMVVLSRHCSIPNEPESKLGVWSVNRKRIKGKQTGVVLKRVREPDEADAEEALKSLSNQTSQQNLISVDSTALSRNTDESVEHQAKIRKVMKSSARRKDPWLSTKKRGRKKLVKPKETSLNPIKKTPPKVLPVNMSPTTKKIPPKVLSTKEPTIKPKPSVNEPKNLTVSLGIKPLENDDNDSLLVSVGDEQKTYICQTCNKVFDTLQLLKVHKKTSHKLTTLRCLKCSKRFSTVENLVKHDLVAHTNKTTENVTPELTVVLNKPLGIRQYVARKSTGGMRQTRKTEVKKEEDEDEEKNVEEMEVSEVKKEAEFCVVVSDEEMPTVEIEPEKDVTIQEVLQTALAPQFKPEGPEQDLFETALEPQLFQPNEPEVVNNHQEDLIIDVTDDQDDDPVIIVPNDESESNQPAPSSSLMLKQIPTADLQLMNPQTSNEETYLNYIFKKCLGMSESDSAQSWLLKDIKKFTRNNYIIVNLEKSPTDDVRIAFVPTLTKPQTPIATLLWDPASAVDVSKRKLTQDKELTQTAKDVARSNQNEVVAYQAERTTIGQIPIAPNVAVQVSPETVASTNTGVGQALSSQLVLNGTSFSSYMQLNMVNRTMVQQVEQLQYGLTNATVTHQTTTSKVRIKSLSELTDNTKTQAESALPTLLYTNIVPENRPTLDSLLHI